MNKFIKLLGGLQTDWDISSIGRGEDVIVGVQRGTDTEDEELPYYQIYSADSSFQGQQIPSRINEPVILLFGNHGYQRTFSITFSTFYELVAYLHSAQASRVSNWFCEDKAPITMEFLSVEAAMRHLDGREIAKRIEPLKTKNMTLSELLDKTIGARKFPEVLADFVEELYEADNIPLTYKQSQDDTISTINILAHNGGGMEGVAEICLLLGDNYDTEIEVTQVINSCPPAYQIWFEMNGKSYFFGSEHSIFLY